MGVDIAAAGQAIGALAGLFKGGSTKRNRKANASAVEGAVWGARQAEEMHGVNFLTALGIANPNAAAGAGFGQSPLASMAVLGDGLDKMFGQQSKDAEQARVHNRLANELLAIQVDQARAAVQAGPPPSAVARVGGGTAAMNGGRSASVVLDGTIRRDPTAFGARISGVEVSPDPGYSDAERIEERYGDIMQAIYGVAVAGADFGTSLATENWSPLQKDRFKPDGYTEDGRPFWRTADGVTWKKPVARDGGKDY